MKTVRNSRSRRSPGMRLRYSACCILALSACVITRLQRSTAEDGPNATDRGDREDNTSTFALDVDTASYTLRRQAAQRRVVAADVDDPAGGVRQRLRPALPAAARATASPCTWTAARLPASHAGSPATPAAADRPADPGRGRASSGATPRSPSSSTCRARWPSRAGSTWSRTRCTRSSTSCGPPTPWRSSPSTTGPRWSAR